MASLGRAVLDATVNFVYRLSRRNISDADEEGRQGKRNAQLGCYAATCATDEKL